MENNPDELQIIDEIITIDHINSIANNTGFTIKHFESKDFSMTDQYVHCILQKKKPIESLISNKPKSFKRIFRRILRIYRQRKYIDKIFK